MLAKRQLTPIEESEVKAKEVLDGSIYDFIAGGAGSEWGLQNNREVFQQYSIIPRVLRGVTEVDTRLELLGRTLASPILIAPCAFHKMVCAEGEIATARAAERAGTIMTLSTMSTYTIEDVAAASRGPKWFQLYIFKNRAITESLVRRAESAGYEALVVTVDVPLMGMRLRDIRNKFSLPPGIDAANFRESHLSSLSDKTDGSKVKEHTDQQFDASLTWESIHWLKSISRLPIILKGILSTADAVEALNHDISAIVVSNHGGRQVDGAESSLNVLPDIVDAIGNRIPIIVDGGIRSGEEAFKALALGARAVMIGRPVMWSLAIGGEEALVSTFSTLAQELSLTMRLTGCASLDNIHEYGLSLLSGQSIMIRKLLQQLEKLASKPEDAPVARQLVRTLFSR